MLMFFNDCIGLGWVDYGVFAAMMSKGIIGNESPIVKHTSKASTTMREAALGLVKSIGSSSGFS
jgi:hypothetical protein